MVVFGEPYEANDGTVVITVSRPGRRGRSGSAVGLYTVNARGATWTPALDSSRYALIGACAGFAAAVLGTVAVVRRPPWPEMTERVMTAIVQARATSNRS